MAEMNRSARFWDRLAERYAKMPVRDTATYQKKLEVTRSYFRPEMEVLEIGCGTGSTALAHAPYVTQVRAFDISANMLAIARGKAQAAQVSNVRFEQGSIESVDLPVHSVDALLALNLLHLVDDPAAFIRRAHALLKPGGIFVTSTPCLGDAMAFMKYVAPLGVALGLMPPVRVFGMAELLDSMRTSGFAIEHEWLPGKYKALFVVARKT
jgi:ubiquinone/menaquinone biosynthesis C-methylase UbiE